MPGLKSISPMGLLFSFISYSRFVIIILWLGIAALGGLRASTLFNNLEDSLEPPYHSRSAEASRVFYGHGLQPCDVMALTASRLKPSTTPILEDEYIKYVLHEKMAPQNYYNGVLEWWTANETGLELMKPLFISRDQQATVMFFPEYTNYPPYITSQANSYNTKPDEYEFVCVSQQYLADSTGNAAQDDLAKMDKVSIPLALVVLAWRVRSIPMMLIPIVTLPLSLLVAISMLAEASHHINFPNFTPALFVSTAVAMGFDWSLFMLTRYKEGVRAGKTNEQCVRETVQYAGHTVLMSGITLCIAYCALLGFPVKFISAVGIGAIITLTACILVNITLTPALLLIFPGFFQMDVSFDCLKCRRHACCCASRPSTRGGASFACLICRPSACRASCCPGGGSDDPDHSHSNPYVRGFESPPPAGVADPLTAHVDDEEAVSVYGKTLRIDHGQPLSSAEDADISEEEMVNSIWYKLVSFVARHPLAVIIVVVVLGSPLTYYSTELRYTSDQNQLHPRNKGVYGLWRDYTHNFPAGVAMPYALIATPVGNRPVHVEAPALVDLNNKLIQVIIDRTGIEPFLFSGPTWVNGKPYNYQDSVDMLQNVSSPLYGTPEGSLSRYRNTGPCNHVDLSSGVFYTDINTPFDPQGYTADEFIRRARTAIDWANSQGIGKFYLGQGNTSMFDVVTEVFEKFAAVITVTIAVLLVIVCFAYRSIVGALRLVFTVGLALSWCFGGGVIIFQTPMLNGTGQSLSDIHAFFWMSPVLTFSLVIGLAVDYDIFLTSRVREYRSRGFDNTTAVIRGFYRTGAVITSAGLIMVISFGSLMLSSQMLLVEAGFFLSFSVFLDTFIIRSLLVPAVMVLLGRWNWWPSKLPPAKGASPSTDGHPSYSALHQ